MSAPVERSLKGAAGYFFSMAVKLTSVPSLDELAVTISERVLPLSSAITMPPCGVLAPNGQVIS